MTDLPPHQEFLDDVERFCGAGGREAAVKLIDAAGELGLQVKRQQPHADKGSSVALLIRGLSNWDDATPLVFFSHGRISWQLKRLRTHNPFKIAGKEEELRTRLAALPSTELEKPDWPDTLLDDLQTQAGFEAFREILAWTAERIRKAKP